MRPLALLLLVLAAGASAPARAEDRPEREVPKVLLSDFAPGDRPALVEALAHYEARRERARLRPEAADRTRAAATLRAARTLE